MLLSCVDNLDILDGVSSFCLWGKSVILFPFEDASANNTALFGPGSGPIYGTNVRCTAEESRLVDCVASVDVTSCSHASDAGVTCNRNCRVSFFSPLAII